MQENTYIFLKGAIDVENRSTAFIILYVNQRMRILNVAETELNNTVNETHIEFNDFIYSGLDTIGLRKVRSEERRLHSQAKTQ